MKNTSRTLKALLAVSVIGFAMAQSTFASSVTFKRINGHYAGVTGGEYTALGTPFAGNYHSSATATVGGQTGFQTFCLELSEDMRLNTAYNYTVNSAAEEGGAGGPSPDPLSMGTSWLYSDFAAGTLTGYDYTPGAGRSSSAGELQNAIWWLEEEIVLVDPSANIFLAAAIAQFGSAALARADASAGTYNVWALNPTDAQGTHRQSVLVIDRPSVIRVPDGGLTLGLLGLSLLGIARLRKTLSAIA